MKQVFLLIFMLCSIALFGQTNKMKTVTAIKNKKDTISIKHYDVSNNLVFEMGRMICGEVAEFYFHGYLYDNNNQATRFIFLYHNSLKIWDIEYDSLQKIIKVFKKPKDEFLRKIDSLPKINNIKDLEKLTIFKETIEQDGYLYFMVYYMDTLPKKMICFEENGDTSDIIDYSYNDQNLLILQRTTFNSGNSDSTVYTYDTLGRILYENKPSSLYKYDYETQNITKRYEISKGEITSTEIAEYKDDNIVKLTFELGCFISYNYDKENRLVSEFHSECFGNKSFEIKYIYK
jgi:hypothetical protein